MTEISYTMKKLNRFRRNGVPIPEHIRGDICRYIEKGIPNGQALTCLFSNDVLAALGRLDDETFSALGSILAFIVSECPVGSYGSAKTVTGWCIAGGVKGQGGWKAFGL